MTADNVSSGAKARFYVVSNGTTEVVPFHKTVYGINCEQASKAGDAGKRVPPASGITGITKT